MEGSNLKLCRSCGNEKPSDDFHIRKASVDGLSAKCRQCQRHYDSERLNCPKRIALRLAYSKTEKGIQRGNSAKKEWEKRNPKKKHAATTVCNAIRDGKMTRKPCEVCGSAYRIHAHHDDYDKIYDVRFLCSAHHREWHRLNGEAKNPF